eukprot:1156941_1
MASNLFLNKASKASQPKPTNNKHFKTSKEEQTAPIQNNATIYRAGQNPNKKHITYDDDDDASLNINASSHITDHLQRNQQPTFVDVLKHRRDHLGRAITKRQIISNKRHEPPLITPTQETQQPLKHTPHQPTIPKNEPTTTKMESSDESSEDDFDMDNLTVPDVTDSVTTNNNPNEADDIREKFKKRLQIQKEAELESAPVIVANNIGVADHEEESEDESSSEYETDSSSDESESHNPRNRKITFLSKKQRENYNAQSNKMSLDEEAEMVEEMEIEKEEKLKQETSEAVLDYIRQRDKQEREGGDESDEEAEMVEEMEIEKEEKLKQETSEAVLDYIRQRDKQEREGGDESDEEMPDDNDDLEVEEAQKAFEAWKLREIKRNLRDETAREQRVKEKEELERRRKMTDDEILRENEKLGLNKAGKKKGNMKFMQKYYHQGVFYRDGSIVEDGVLDRNFNAPTGEDKWINFEKVPEAMKRKNFGKMSQSKWTHLANEDTTFDKEEREWFKKKNSMNEEEKKRMKNTKYQFRHRAHQDNFWFQRGGNGALERPSYKKGNMESANRRFERTFDREERDKMRGRDPRDDGSKGNKGSQEGKNKR